MAFEGEKPLLKRLNGLAAVNLMSLLYYSSNF
jgi:hypothetical protein